MNKLVTLSLFVLLGSPSVAVAVDECLPQSAVFVPGQGAFGMLMFEDMYPARGDFDLNDVVVSYNWELHVDALGRLTRALLTLTPLASGGRIDSGVALTLPWGPDAFSVTATLDGAASTPVIVEANGSGALIRAIANTKALFGVPAGTHVNADPGVVGGARRTTVRGQSVLVDIRLATPTAFTAASFAPGDIFIFHSDRPSVEIHLPSRPGTAAFDAQLYRTADDASVDGVRYFVDRSGIPFALALPTASVFPREGMRLELVYPQIVEFGASGGTAATSFYASPNTSTDVAVTPGFDDALTNDHPRSLFNAGAIPACAAVNVFPPSTVILGEMRPDGVYRTGCPDGWNVAGVTTAAGPGAVGCGTAACQVCESPATPSLVPADFVALMSECPASWTDVGTPQAGPLSANCGASSCRLCRSSATSTLPSGASFVGPSCAPGWTDEGSTGPSGPGSALCPGPSGQAQCRRCAAPGA